jgi:hypothetical protein
MVVVVELIFLTVFGQDRLYTPTPIIAVRLGNSMAIQALMMIALVLAYSI